MAAKTATKRTTTRKRGASGGDAEELLNLLTGVFRLLKKRAGSGPKHEELRVAFEEGELGDRHVNPLIALIIGGPASVGELAKRIGLTLGTTSLLVGELSRAGLVERREDDRDRRRTIVSISAQVEAVMRPWLRETLRPLGRTLDRMSAAQRAHFMDGLRILNEEIGRSAGNGSG